jgi:hypothetical protein
VTHGLTPEWPGSLSSFGSGILEVEVLLDKHESPDCVKLESSTSERNCVLPTRKYLFYRNCRTCEFKS